MEAIVLAGGFGTRLAHIVSDVPKPMASVSGRPFLEYILTDLVQNGVDHIVIAVHHMKETIMNYFGNTYQGAAIDYSVEEIPLKTGGAIKKALSLCREDRVLIINGDTFYKVPLRDMLHHAQNVGTPICIAVREMTNFSRYGKADVSEDGFITAFHEKELCAKGYINGGIYAIEKNVLDKYPQVFSIEELCFPNMLADRKIAAFVSNAYFIDIGIPEDYARAQKDFQEYMT